MSGIGYVIAKHLAATCRARLVLVGRSPFDEIKERKLQELSELGGRAIYVAADVTDLAEMRTAFLKMADEFGCTHGVVHSAGVHGGVNILQETMEEFAATCAPKVAGTLVLHELLKECKLDFFCCFSSSSAFLGDFGSCDYAVANRFEVAYAKYASAVGIAIGWSMWVDGGLIPEDEDVRELYLRTSGQQRLSTADGIALFEDLLRQRRNNGVSHSLVIRGEERRVYEIIGIGQTRDRPKTGRKGRGDAQEQAWTGLSVEQCVKQELQEVTSALLQLPLEEIAEHSNLVDFGFDSILLADFAKRISDRFSVEILPSVFFSHPTIGRVADHLLLEHAAQLRGRYERPLPANRTEAVSARAGAAPQVPVDLLRGQQPNAVALASGSSESIAIIGISGRFPEARSVKDLWKILINGADAVQPVSTFGVRREHFRASNRPTAVPRRLGMVPGVDEFDALFFELSPLEAERMEPRQRLLMQESYRALEDAGLGPSQLRAQRVGVYVGVEHSAYGNEGSEGQGELTSNHEGVLAARLSYFLDLRGPVLAINTACSSGLVAFHQACMSLHAGECDVAIAAAANVVLEGGIYDTLERAGMLSQSGFTRAFDRRADGIVPGEAVVAIVLKRLSKANSDGDLIYAVVRGSGINYDGKTNGLTAPSGAAQAELIQAVHRRAGVSAREVGYIVTHGTGTRLGDSVEISALQEAFKGVHAEEPFCALTSIKPNVGHAFAASGLVSMAGLVQAIFTESFRRACIARSLATMLPGTAARSM